MVAAANSLSWMKRLGKAVGFKYDALEPRGKRRSVPRSVYREDHYMRGRKHTGLQSNAADLARNLSLAAWMVRRHLDYVSQFAFNCKGDNEGLNEQIERLMREDSTPARTDIAGRFGREKMFRLAEMRRVLDGDTALVKHNDGRMQGIQADLIKDPGKTNEGEDWINGVLVTGVGRPLSYSVNKRKGYVGDEPDRRIDAPNLIHYGFFDRYAADQVRGVSPMVASLNPLRDVYENFDYALAKAKVHQIFAMSIYRDANQQVYDEDALLDNDEEGDEEGDEGEDGDACTPGKDPYEFDFSKPQAITLDPGDRAEILESNQPSTEFQNFTQLVIAVALKSLDIPYSFYDEAHTNFFGSRAAWLHYERSCRDRREDQIEMRRNYTLWKLRTWIRDGRLTLPAGMTVYDIDFEWIPIGMPWWDPAKEIRGNVEAIGAGLDNPQNVCKKTGSIFEENIKMIAKAQSLAKSMGVSLSFVPEPISPEEQVAQDKQDQIDKEAIGAKPNDQS